MLRLHFTTEDLARTHFLASPAPLMETVMTVAALRDPAMSRRAPSGLGAVRRSFPPVARPLLDLVSASRGPSFIDPLSADLDEGLELVDTTPATVVAAELARCLPDPRRTPSWSAGLARRDGTARRTLDQAFRGFFAACLRPRWSTITATFQRDIDRRSTVLSTRGLAGVWESLHLRWCDGVLHVPHPADADVRLDGRGVRLMPSAHWTGRPLVTIRPEGLGPHALVYAAAPLPRGDGDGAPPTVLGRTRTMVLRSLLRPCGTRELAGRLGISEAAASEQASALRAGGLITTERRGRSVRHSPTRLGRELIDRSIVSPTGTEP